MEVKNIWKSVILTQPYKQRYCNFAEGKETVGCKSIDMNLEELKINWRRYESGGVKFDLTNFGNMINSGFFCQKVYVFLLFLVQNWLQ